MALFTGGCACRRRGAAVPCERLRAMLYWIHQDFRRGGGALQIVDMETWERREAYEFFSRMEYPFYSVTIPVDVTNVKAVSSRAGVSFYHLMIWVCTKAVNAVPAFRLRVRDGQVVRLAHTEPSFTSLRGGSEQFQIITIPWEEDWVAFCGRAAEVSGAQTAFITPASADDGLIYFSCLPWFDFTALTNEHRLDRDDTVPRLAWGKYFTENGRLMVHLSVEVNHRLLDGRHIGALKERLDDEIATLR